MSDIIDDIIGSSVELNTEKKEEKPEVKEEPKEEAPKISDLENLSEKTEDNVPLKKFMSEKNARREAEAKAKELESEITKLRENPYKSNEDIKVDVKTLSEKHDISEEVLRDILQASYTLSKDKIKQELEAEFNPKLAELENIKRDKARESFETTFNKHLANTLKDMPEYANLVDEADLKDWVRSGKYSNITLPQLIENKYGKFVAGKKTTESYTPAKEVVVPEPEKMTDEDWVNIDKNPELKKKWQASLEDRLRKYM